jgi:hypothetical protein
MIAVPRYIVCTDNKENTSTNSFSIIASRGYRSGSVENTISVIFMAIA